MIGFYLRSAAGSLRNNLRFSLINITGFAFALSVCMGITLYLIHEHSRDRYHENSERIFRLNDAGANSGTVDYRVKDILLGNYPQVEKSCLFLTFQYPFSISTGENGFITEDIASVDNSFFDLFTIEFLAKGSDLPMPDINSAVIARSAASRFFGTVDPIGKDLLIEDLFQVTVTGIIEDFPSNSSFSSELFVNAENDNFKFFQQDSFRPFQIYLQLDESTNPGEFAGQVNSNPGLLAPYCEHVELLALKDIYLRDNTSHKMTRQGNPGLLRLLSAIALIILLLAVILFKFMHQWYISIFYIPLDLSVLFTFPNYIFLAVAILTVGVISGTGPAIIMSGISPVRVFNKMAVIPEKSQRPRNSLTVFQFTVSIVLIFCVLTIMRQIRHVKYADPGFKSEQLLKIDFPGLISPDHPGPHLVKAELIKSPYILNISASQGVPGNVTSWMGTNMENTDLNLMAATLMVDTSFLETFDLKTIRGRTPGPGDYGKVCMMNEAAWRHFRFEDLENKRFNNYGGFDIIGVVNDFHYSSLHNTIEPLFILFTPDISIRSLNIRFDGRNTDRVLRLIEEKWQEIMPGSPLKLEFYDEKFASMYREEERFARSIGLFALLAIVISCIGIFGLAVFSAERRTKEIGIRKVNGARVAGIMLLLNREFLKWVGIAFLIAVPVSWYVMDRWLQNFAYRTELSWWIFAVAGLLALAIALLTVSWQSWQAARRNPVEALRYE